VAPTQPRQARLINWFSMPVDTASFSGVPGVTGLASLPKAKALLAAAMDRRVVCCDLTAPLPKTKRLGPIVPAKHLNWAHENWIHDIAVHPDGVRVATGGYDRHVKLWRWGEEKPLADIKAHDDWVRVVAFSPDGKILASAGDDGLVRLWESESGKAVATLDSGSGRLDVMAWSIDNKQLLVSGNDGVLRFWNVESRKVARSIDLDNRRLIEDEPLNGGFSYPGGLRGLACSPDGKLVAAVGLTSLHVLEMPTGKEVLQQVGRGFGVAFSPDSKLLAFSQEMQLLVWDFSTKQISHRIVGDQLGLFAMFFRDGGKLLTAGGCNGRVGTWELSS
jgi:WD40 repeat protein